MNSLNELKRLLSAEQPAVSGKVIQVRSGQVLVATSKGVAWVTGTGLAIGTQVVVLNGSATLSAQANNGQVFRV